MYQRFSKYQAGTPCLATKNLKFDPLLCQIFRSLSGVVFRTWYQSFILQFLLASAAFSKTRWNGLSQLFKALGCQFNGSSLRPVLLSRASGIRSRYHKKRCIYIIFTVYIYMISHDYLWLYIRIKNIHIILRKAEFLRCPTCQGNNFIQSQYPPSNFWSWPQHTQLHKWPKQQVKETVNIGEISSEELRFRFMWFHSVAAQIM